ncbi:DNA-binding protein [Lysobacter soli]|uniref:DNA-binding protein n=1 Tax=Lysobacter soli TaxID=453783 RepID=UPI0037C66FF2
MAKGITETDVHGAADALVAAGERPTVERIRAHLGTGSPNTVIRWLDTWWQALGGRLASDRGRRALPDAPSVIAALAAELWEQALLAARTEAEARLEGDRSSLAAERANMQQALAQAHQELTVYREAAAIAEQGKVAADVRLADAQRLIEHQAAQLGDLAAQRHALRDRVDALEAERTGLAEHLQQQESVARAERESQLLHTRSLEDRAHAEVDRVRQEAKALQRRIDALLNEHAAQQQALGQRLEESRVALAEALRVSASHQGRADVLEQQLAQLTELQAALQDVLTQARKPVRKGRARPATRSLAPKGRARPKQSP